MTENNSCKIASVEFSNYQFMTIHLYSKIISITITRFFSFVMLGLVDADYGFLLVDIGANISTEDVPIQDTNPVSLPHNERNEI